MGGDIRVSSETDSTEALKRFRQAPQTYDLIITDMTMPVMSGDEMASEMMAIQRDIPIILCTGFHQDISEETALEKGFKAYLMKPLGLNDLTLTVRQVLDAAGDDPV